MYEVFNGSVKENDELRIRNSSYYRSTNTQRLGRTSDQVHPEDKNVKKQKQLGQDVLEGPRRYCKGLVFDAKAHDGALVLKNRTIISCAGLFGKDDVILSLIPYLTFRLSSWKADATSYFSYIKEYDFPHQFV